jgi:hypothetical protein
LVKRNVEEYGVRHGLIARPSKPPPEKDNDEVDDPSKRLILAEKSHLPHGLPGHTTKLRPSFSNGRTLRSPQSIRGYASHLPPYHNSNKVFDNYHQDHTGTKSIVRADDTKRKTYLSAYDADTAISLKTTNLYPHFRG